MWGGYRQVLIFRSYSLHISYHSASSKKTATNTNNLLDSLEFVLLINQNQLSISIIITTIILIVPRRSKIHDYLCRRRRLHRNIGHIGIRRQIQGYWLIKKRKENHLAEQCTKLIKKVHARIENELALMIEEDVCDTVWIEPWLWRRDQRWSERDGTFVKGRCQPIQPHRRFSSSSRRHLFLPLQKTQAPNLHYLPA